MANNEARMSGIPNPARSHLFHVDIGNSATGHFTEVEGGGVRVNAIPYREGGANQIVHQLVGPVDYVPITLRYGVVRGDHEMLWKWLMTAVKGPVERKNVSIVLLDVDQQETMRWNYIDCWPAKWTGGKMDALGKSVLIQEMTLVYQELKLGT